MWESVYVWHSIVKKEDKALLKYFVLIKKNIIIDKNISGYRLISKNKDWKLIMKERKVNLAIGSADENHSSFIFLNFSLSLLKCDVYSS